MVVGFWTGLRLESGSMQVCWQERQLRIWQEKVEYGERRFSFDLFLNDDTIGICLRTLGNGFQCFSAVNLIDLVSE